MRSLPAVLIFAAAGAGYVYTHPDVAKGLSVAQWITEEGEQSEVVDKPSPEVAARLASAKTEEVIAVTGPEVADFGHVFRFDLTPEAIAQKWSRVSTMLSDPQFQGYRVPLVTGTAASDLAGSLTYYFDGQPRLRRITFLGTTGDPNRIVGYMAKYYGFRQVAGSTPRSMVYRTRSRFTGELTVTPAEVLEKSLSSTNYRVVLSVQR
jgi:hypothetical protein